MVQLITRRGRRNAGDGNVASIRITPLLDENAVQIRVCSNGGGRQAGLPKDIKDGGSCADNDGFVYRYVISDALDADAEFRHPDPGSQKRYVVSRVQEKNRVQPVRIAVLDQGNIVAQTMAALDQDIKIQLQSAHLWTPEDPYFYDLEIEFGENRVTSYFEMR